MTLFSHTNFWCFHHLVLITQHAFATVKGSMLIKKRHLFLKMEPKSATDIMAIAASVVEIAIFVCDMLLEGVSPGLSTPRAYSLFFFFFLNPPYSKRSDVGRNNYIPSWFVFFKKSLSHFNKKALGRVGSK